MGKTLTSLIKGGTDSKLVLLEAHEAGIAESTFTHTLSPALTSEDTSAIIIYITGESTAAFNLELELNADSSALYIQDGFRITGTVETILQNVNDAFFTPASITMIDAANINFATEINIMIPDSSDTNPFPLGFSKAYSRNGNYENFALLFNKSFSTITSIKISTSISTWKAGTHIDIYRVKNT